MKIKNIGIENRNNRPTIIVNNEIVAPFIFALSDIPGARTNTLYAQKNIKKFSESGINLVAIDCSLSLCYHKAVGIDFRSISEEIKGVLDANKNALILIRLHLNPPYWWLRDNPQECIKYRTEHGDIEGIDNGEQSILLEHDSKYHLRVSMASKKWKEEMGKILKELCSYLEHSEEGESVCAIQVSYGTCGEWHNFGCDVSDNMESFFRDYIKDKYKTVQNLRNTYKDDKVDFDTAIFCPEYFRAGDKMYLLDPEKSINAIDSRYAQQLATVEAIVYFAKIVKETFTRPILTGTFYGYLIWVMADTIDGQLFPEILFKNKEYIQFLAGPMPYSLNRTSQGASIQRGLMESCRLNSVLWICEMDQRPKGLLYNYLDDNKYDEESIAILKRHILQVLLAGQGAWYYDHKVVDFVDRAYNDDGTLIALREEIKSVYRKLGWWERDIFQKEIKKLNDFSKKFMMEEYQPQADVLVVFDEKRIFYRIWREEKSCDFLIKLAKSGVCYDTIYLSDLDKCDKDRYKCVFFYDTHFSYEKDRAFIKEFIKGKTAVFFENAFCSTEKHISLKNTSEIIGLELEEVGNQDFVKNIFGEEIKLTLNHKEKYMFYSVKMNNTYHILSKYANGEICAVQNDNIFYYSYYELTQSELKNILKESGAFIYVEDGNIAMAGGNYLAIYTYKGGKIEVNFKNGKTITRDFSPISTVLFNSSTGKEIL